MSSRETEEEPARVIQRGGVGKGVSVGLCTAKTKGDLASLF